MWNCIYAYKKVNILEIPKFTENVIIWEASQNPIGMNYYNGNKDVDTDSIK